MDSNDNLQSKVLIKKVVLFIILGARRRQALLSSISKKKRSFSLPIKPKNIKSQMQH